MRVLATVFSVLVLLANGPISNANVPTPIGRACSEPEHQQYPFCDTKLSTEARIDDLISRLTTHEKVQMLTARASPNDRVPRLGVPEYDWGGNCVHGVQSSCGTNCPTSFPNPVNFGAVFDPQAAYDMAEIIGWELRALWLEGATEASNNIHIGLDCWSPNININRDPRWGRNMETPSEDPLINGLYGAAYSRGLQEGKDPKYMQAVVTLKHWFAYSFDDYDHVNRMAFDALVSNYDFVDTYLPAFRTSVIDGKARGIMCSYNSLNGMPMCTHDAMNSLLRDTYKFQGYVTTDSGALEGYYKKAHFGASLCEVGKLSIMRGTDVNSGSVYQKCLESLVMSKELDEKYIDAAMRNTLQLRFDLGLFDPIENQTYWHVAPSEVNKKSSMEKSLEITRKSLILLQNEKQVLPLKRRRKLAVIGPHIEAREALLGNYLGWVCHGGRKDFDCVESPAEAMRAMNGEEYTMTAKGSDVQVGTEEDLVEALNVAKEADTVVLFLGLDTKIEEEVNDRRDIRLPEPQMRLLRDVRKLKKPMVVVLLNGGVIGAEEIVLQTDGLVEAFYPGIYGAQAMAEALFGDYNPGGKLPVTMYRSDYVDKVSMKSMSMTAYPGRSYRYYKEIPVFPFGWGLSYTTFRFTGVDNHSDKMLYTENDDKQTIKVKVSNTGDREGDEVVLAYFRPLDVKNATGPATLLNQQLFAYQRISLRPQESANVKIQVDAGTFGLFDNAGNHVVYPGYYEVIITNGVHERVSYGAHVTGAERLLRPFPLKATKTMAKDDPISSPIRDDFISFSP